MKSANLLWLGLGLLVGVTGTVSTQLVLNELDNAPSSEWVIPNTAFGEHTIEVFDVDEFEFFTDIQIPEFIDYFDLILPYGEDYFVTRDSSQTGSYNDATFNYSEYTITRYNKNGLVTWTYTFELEPTFAYATSQDYYDAVDFDHMVLEGDEIIIVATFANRLNFFDPIQNQDATAENGNRFNAFGGGPNAGNFVQSILRFNINTQQFTLVASDSLDVDRYDSEDFERIGPYRYAFGQEFDNEFYDTFTHNYHGEDLVFLEATESIALLSELTINPTNNTATFETKGKWSSTQSVDIDIYPIRNVRQEVIEITEAELMVVNIYLNLNEEEIELTREGSLITAEDNILSSADQSLIDQAGQRFINELDLEYIRYEYNAVLDLDFNMLSYELYEESKLFTANYTYLNGDVYWVEENKFIFINYNEVQTIDGVSVSGNTIIKFKTGTRLTKTFALANYGNLLAFNFHMDDAGNMIFGGKLISNDTYDISINPRMFILFVNKDFEVIDEFILDSEDAGANLYFFVIEDNQIKAYFTINQHVGPFANFPNDQWEYLLTIDLL